PSMSPRATIPASKGGWHLSGKGASHLCQGTGLIKLDWSAIWGQKKWGLERAGSPLRDGSGYLGFSANNAAVRGPTEEGRTDERVDDSLARPAVETQQSRCLSRR